MQETSLWLPSLSPPLLSYAPPIPLPCFPLVFFPLPTHFSYLPPSFFRSNCHSSAPSPPLGVWEAITASRQGCCPLHDHASNPRSGPVHGCNHTPSFLPPIREAGSSNHWGGGSQCWGQGMKVRCLTLAKTLPKCHPGILSPACGPRWHLGRLSAWPIEARVP